jgi:hypothetical protein
MGVEWLLGGSPVKRAGEKSGDVEPRDHVGVAAFGNFEQHRYSDTRYAICDMR